MKFRGHGGRVVTLSPPTSEAGVQFPAQPQVGKFTVQNPDMTRRDMTCTVLKAT